MAASDDRDLYSGMIRLHVLHHACKGPVFGLGMLDELDRHGYKISPGTLYPLLHRLEKKGVPPIEGTARGKVVPKAVQRDAAGKKSAS